MPCQTSRLSTWRMSAWFFAVSPVLAVLFKPRPELIELLQISCVHSDLPCDREQLPGKVDGEDAGPLAMLLPEAVEHLFDEGGPKQLFQAR